MANNTAAFILSLIGGILILLNGILLAAIFGIMGTAMGMFSMMAETGGAAAMGGLMITLGIILAIIFGAIVLVGAIYINSPKSAHTASILVIVFSVLSLFIGGGFIVGAILGIIGGALGLARK